MLPIAWLNWYQKPHYSRRCSRPRRTRLSRPLLEQLEDRALPSVTIAPTNNSGQGYVGLDFNHSGGFVPPDTCGAAGPTNYVETVNQTLAIYSPKATGASEASATGGSASTTGATFAALVDLSVAPSLRRPPDTTPSFTIGFIAAALFVISRATSR